MDDGSEGRRRKDEGTKRVKDANAELMVFGLVLIRALRPGWIGLIENIRTMIEARGKFPTHNNFYGSLGREAIKMGLLIRTGRRVQMKRPKAHARMTDELMRPLS